MLFLIYGHIFLVLIFECKSKRHFYERGERDKESQHDRGKKKESSPASDATLDNLQRNQCAHTYSM